MRNEAAPASDDDLLFAEAQKGDPAAFGKWIGRNYTFVYRLSYRLLGNKMDAEDLTHDVCLALPGKIRSFQGKGSVRGWLAQVVLNAGRDGLRKQKRRRAAGLDGCSEAGVQGNAVDRLYLHQVLAAMDQMPLKSRDALLLAAEGLTQAEIAVALDCAAGTVAWRVSTARAELARLLDRDGIERPDEGGKRKKGGTPDA